MERAGIAKLMEAEAKAKELIEGAKRERAALQKQSKIEAEQSIAEFKDQKDAEYKQLTSSIDTSDYARGLNEEVDKEIAAMRANSKANMDAISRMLLDFTAEVDTSVHKNNRVKA